MCSLELEKTNKYPITFYFYVVGYFYFSRIQNHFIRDLQWPVSRDVIR